MWAQDQARLLKIKQKRQYVDADHCSRMRAAGVDATPSVMGLNGRGARWELLHTRDDWGSTQRPHSSRCC